MRAAAEHVHFLAVSGSSRGNSRSDVRGTRKSNSKHKRCECTRMRRVRAASARIQCSSPGIARVKLTVHSSRTGNHAALYSFMAKMLKKLIILIQSAARQALYVRKPDEDRYEHIKPAWQVRGGYPSDPGPCASAQVSVCKCLYVEGLAWDNTGDECFGISSRQSRMTLQVRLYVLFPGCRTCGT